MMLRTFAALFIASGTLLAAAPASAQAADTSKVMGLRFEASFFNQFDVRGTEPTVIVVSEDGAFQSGPSPSRTDVFRPQGDLRIGYDLPMGLTPLIGFGLRSRDVKILDDSDKKLSSTGRTDIVLAAELRYYFAPHKRGLQPYVFGEFNTTIASFGTENSKDEPVNEAEDAVLGDENSVVNLNAGLGLEYKFAKSFGIGAKWGAGLSLAGTSVQKKGNKEAGINTTNTVFGTSSTLYAAFRI